MKIELKPEHEKLVQERLRSGLYANESDVVFEALEALKSQESELKRAIEEGLADYRAGRFAPLDMKQTIAAAQRRFKGGNHGADRPV